MRQSNWVGEFMLVNYFKRVGARRCIIMVLGNVFLGLGIAVFKLSGLGNDPFSGMVMALSDQAGIAYANFILVVNIFLFAVQFLTGKEFIGAGTLVNACLLGYIVTFFYNIISGIFGQPVMMWERVIIVCIGVVITSFGVSMYQTPDVGIAPYDSLSLIMTKRFRKIPYFWNRIATDAACALICFLAGGIVGLGTLVCAFGLGPFIHFFDEHFSKKLVGTVEK